MNVVKIFFVFTLLISTQAFAQSVTLHSVVNDGSNITINYDKDFATCAHLKEVSTDLLVHTQNHYCGSGNNVEVTVDLTSFHGDVSVGTDVYLCHGNDSSICSAVVTIAGTNVGAVSLLTSIKDTGRTVTGSSNPDNLNGTHGNDRIISGGLSSGTESIRTRGGADRIVFGANDSVLPDTAGIGVGAHIRIRDFIIDNIQVNPEADSVSLGRLIGVDNLDASNIGNYLYVISGAGNLPGPGLIDGALFGWDFHRTVVFVNLEGDYSSSDRQALRAGRGHVGGHGTDLVLEFQNEQGNNNFRALTGHPNNTVEQFQSLIDMGFLELSTTDIYGSSGGDTLEGTLKDERIFSGGTKSQAESIRSNGGADRLLFEADDIVTDGHIRVRDFVIDDIQLNTEADSVALNHVIGLDDLDASNIGDYLHVVSGCWGHVRTAVFISLDGNLDASDRQALDSCPSSHTVSNYGVEFLLEFQGQGANNNFETLTGFTDNSVGQFQTLIDWGFLEL